MSGSLKDYKIDKEISLFNKEDSPKKKPGRPKRDNERSKKVVVLYLYGDEYEKLRKIAKLESMSSFIRCILKEKFNI